MINTDNAAVYTDFNGLAKLKHEAREQSPQAIKAVAKQFESVFLNMVMKSMRQAKLAEGVLDSKQSEFFQDMYDQQMAVNLASESGVGLADIIAKQLSPKEKPDPDEKLQVSDYLNRAMGVNSQNPSKLQPASVVASEQPLRDSGLSQLQESLERLEQSQQALNEKWQSIQADLPRGEMAANKHLFMSQLLPYAQNAANELGVDANILLAQAALETGWGKSLIKNPQGDSSFNLFNIKADKSWQGDQARVSTLEYENGVAKKTMAGFRSYDSYKQSFDDYVNFIKSNPRYSDALKKADNPVQYVRELQKAGYATDPRYAEKVMRIYQHQIANSATVDMG